MKYRSKLLNQARVKIIKDENQTRINVLVSLVFLALIGFAFILPAASSVREAVEKKNSLVKTKEKLIEVNKSYELAATYMEEVSAVKNEVYKLIPDDPSPGDVIGTITLYSTKNYLDFSNLRLVEKTYAYENYTVNLLGSYGNISTFFKDFANDGRYYKIEGLNISLSKDVSDDLLLNVNLKAFTGE